MSLIYLCIKTVRKKKTDKYFSLPNVYLVQNSNVWFIKGLHMHQNFILKLFEHHRHIQSVQNFVFIVIYLVVLLLWVIEFGRIFELYKIHWINQNWQTILQDRSKIYISMFCQAFWVVKSLFDSIYLFPLLWLRTLKIRLFFLPKYRTQLLGSHAKIYVAYCIMQILLRILVIFNKNM